MNQRGHPSCNRFPSGASVYSARFSGLIRFTSAQPGWWYTGLFLLPTNLTASAVGFAVVGLSGTAGVVGGGGVAGDVSGVAVPGSYTVLSIAASRSPAFVNCSSTIRWLASQYSSPSVLPDLMTSP